MSLWFSHGSAQWSYGGFDKFRVKIAEFEGINLYEIYETQNWDGITSPLLPLLRHSDVDGEITPDECRQVAARLREILPEVFALDPYQLDRGTRFVAGAELAAAEDLPLQFL